MEDIKSMHWSEIIALDVVKRKKKPYVLMSGITTSGSLHPGTLCEFLFADAVAKAIRKEAGKCDFLFVADILDAFDNVPEPFKKYEKELIPHLGKPLAHTPDPEGCHPSFGEHFLAEAQEAMEKFGAKPKILKATDNYASGKYDAHAKKYSEKKDIVKEIVQHSSMRKEMPEQWHPIMPICKQCGKVATTRILSYSDGEYEYVCDQDAGYTKGCGYRGKAKISDHEYKLLFRLDWAARHEIFKVSIEGSSVDHHTKGGTLDTVSSIEKEFLKIEPPIFFKFGFLKYKGKKYSKSKGIGHTVTELMELLPEEILKYLLYRPDIEEDKELVIDKDTLFKIVDDFVKAASVDTEDKELARPDQKNATAFSLAADKLNWKADIKDILVYYNIYQDWDKVGELVGDKKGVRYLKKYISKWYEKNLIPDRYYFSVEFGKPTELARKYVEKLDSKMNDVDIHNLVFEVSEKERVQPKQLFRDLYQAIIRKDSGPRLGKLIYAIGVDRVKEELGG